ncbi:unnamed protein product [Somion occarium]|uniref:Uncharacterized protein n=1 Tax=Somion occarium TaxID=3059160 RepID=A0ABP1D457_9APHY
MRLIAFSWAVTITVLFFLSGVASIRGSDTVAKRSSFTDNKSQASHVDDFLRYTSIFGGAKQKFLDIVKGRLEHSNFDFWKHAESLGKKMHTYTDSLLKDAASQVSSASGRIEDVKNTMHTLVSAAAHFEAAVIAHAKEGTTLEAISEDLDSAFAPILEELQKMFPSPDEATHHAERNRTIYTILAKVEDAIVRVGIKHGMNEEDLRKHIDQINIHVAKVVVLVGDLSEQHPILRDTMIFAVVTMLVPESWILKPLLRIFGFGPRGPIKGTPVSWAQRYFYGAAVRKGSWFSHLQRAGMTVVPPGTGKKVIGGVGAGVGIGLSFMRC